MTNPDPRRIVPDPGFPELYNVRDDPRETNNLAALHPERARRMLRELETWFEDADAERQIAHNETLAGA